MSIESTSFTIMDVLKNASEENFEVSLGDETSSIFAADNSFPLDVLNAGCPSTSSFSGNADVLAAIEDVTAQGYTVHLVERVIGDETGFEAGMHQDFKLVITVK